jgi:hypothetical protein
MFAIGAVLAVDADALVRPLSAAPTAAPVDGDVEDESALLRESIAFVRGDANARILLFILGASASRSRRSRSSTSSSRGQSSTGAATGRST